MNQLEWLMGWYAQQCDGDWEHSFGIKLDTLDNPGWYITINLEGTLLQGKPFSPVTVNMDDNDGDPNVHWHHCQIKENQFVGACGVYDLGLVLDIFRQFAIE